MALTTDFADSAPARCSHAVTSAFGLDPVVTFLNHGSFGAVPAPVTLAADQWRQRIEARPIEAIGRRMNDELASV